MMFRIMLCTLSLMLSTAAFTAKDPIAWRQFQTFPPETLISGGTYVADYYFINQIPFTLSQPLIIEKTSNSHEFSYTDLCSGKKLAYLETCRVSIYFRPTTPGMKTVQLTEKYDFNRVPLPILSTLATAKLSSRPIIVGQVTQPLPSTLTLTSSAPWKITYTNIGTAPATVVHVTVSEPVYQTNCPFMLTNVPPFNSCDVQGTFTATSPGVHTIQTVFSYAQGAPVVQETSTTVPSGGALVCTAAVPLAPQTLTNSTAPVTLLCTNQGDLPVTITGRTLGLPAAGQGSFTLDPGGDSCTIPSLPPGGACQLKGIYNAPAAPTTDVTISLSVNYGTSSTASTSTTTDVVTTITNLRNINLVNQCNFDVWWSMVGGAVANTSCTTTSDCPGGVNGGSTCVGGSCKYNNYGPRTGEYHLPANGGTASTQIIQTDASVGGILWSGAISASTQCDDLTKTCANNACQNNGGTTSCAPGVGFAQPATQAEFTLLLTGAGNVDSYDITQVNGFSIPISMASNQPASGYTCGTAGNNVAAGGLNACSFSNVSPPTNMYYWVSLTGIPCTPQNTCALSGQICGLAFSPTLNNFTKNCGDFLGYWAANQICQTRPDFSSPFGDSFTCNQYLSTPFPSSTYTLTQLLKCSPPSATAPLFNSCYLSYPGATGTELMQCCGCTNWSGIATPSQACPAGQVDPQWTQYVQPLIQWMKQACPTAYAYPYDDVSSSFKCTADATTQYTITFCPGGGTGLPAGKTDGRG